MRISVCMATHNGERFIRAQIESILPQLRKEDELIIIDDASSDRTLEIIEQEYSDPRMTIVAQRDNQGVISTFEHALERATRDIVFLADQDDVWRPHKVARMIEVFAADPQISLVLSDCSIINASGDLMASSRFVHTQFRASAVRNIIRNQYLGCSMAFRREILDWCLPFPKDIPMHDMWIGIINQLVGRTEFIAEPLMSYRRHDKNASPHQKRASILQIIRWRWSLIKNLAVVGMHSF